MQAARRVGCADWCAQLQQHRPRVEASRHLHQAHAGFIVAGLDGALDRCGAAPAWQQRGVHIPAAEARDFQHRLGQNQAIGNHDQQIRRERPQGGLRGWITQGFGLQHRYRKRLRCLLHW